MQAGSALHDDCWLTAAPVASDFCQWWWWMGAENEQKLTEGDERQKRRIFLKIVSSHSTNWKSVFKFSLIKL